MTKLPPPHAIHHLVHIPQSGEGLIRRGGSAAADEKISQAIWEVKIKINLQGCNLSQMDLSFLAGGGWEMVNTYYSLSRENNLIQHRVDLAKRLQIFCHWIQI